MSRSRHIVDLERGNGGIEHRTASERRFVVIPAADNFSLQKRFPAVSALLGVAACVDPGGNRGTTRSAGYLKLAVGDASAGAAE